MCGLCAHVTHDRAYQLVPHLACAKKCVLRQKKSGLCWKSVGYVEKSVGYAAMYPTLFDQ